MLFAFHCSCCFFTHREQHTNCIMKVKYIALSFSQILSSFFMCVYVCAWVCASVGVWVYLSECMRVCTHVIVC